MTDEDTENRRELLQSLVSGVDPDKIKAGSVSTASTQIGNPKQSVNKAYLNAESLEWLEQRLHPDGKAYLETVELETELGTICFEVEDGQIVLSYNGENE